MIRHLLLVTTFAGPIMAQSHPAVDSAAAARSAWGQAARADQRGDTAEALAQVQRAVAAWPEQPFYQEALALLAARANDAPSFLAAVGVLTSFESGQRVLTDSAALRLRATTPAAATALARLADALAPKARSREWVRLPDTTIYPEGLDADSAAGTIYLASIRHRTVYRVSRGVPKPVDLQLTRWPGVGAIMGVRVDAARNLIWATTVGLPAMEGYRPADSAIAALLAVRPEDGTIAARYDLPAGQPHIPGDLAIGPAGDVYVTDSRSPVVYRLRPGAKALEPFRHPLFRSLQGVAPTPDGGAVYLADYSHGLLRWTPGSGAVVRVATEPGVTALGLDGILLQGRRLYAVQNGVAPARIVCFEFDPSGERAIRMLVLDRNLPAADEPTILTRLGDRIVYVANSQWEKFDEAGARRPGTTLAPTVLLSLPLTP